MACKDCNKKKCNCEVIYKRIELPDSYDFSIDSNSVFGLFVPINEYNPSEEYFTDFSELSDSYDSFSGPGFTPAIGGANNAILNSCGSIHLSVYPSISDAVTFINAQDWSGCGTSKHIAYCFIVNENYGKPISPKSPGILSWPLKPDVSSYEELVDPLWKLDFPYCGAGSDKLDSTKFKISGCDTVKVEYRLRLRPLVFLGWPQDGNCDDYYPLSGESIESDANRKLMWLMYRWAQSLKNQQGAKYMGLTPLRLETGIYDEVTKEQKPIVWSKGKYPQPILKSRNIWDSKYKNGKYLYSDNCPIKKTWSGMTPNLIPSSLETIEIKYPTEPYKYSFSSVADSGLFSVANNNITSPTKIRLSNKSQLFGDIYKSQDIPQKLLKDGPYNFFSRFEYVSSSYGKIEIYQYGLINSKWVKLRRIIYSITGILKDLNFIECNITHLSTVNYDIPNIESATTFYNGTTVKTKYEIIPILNKKTYDVPKMTWADIVIGNVSELTDDFVYELEGFCHVDLEKTPEFSIYLKAIPDHPGTPPLEMDDIENIPAASDWSGVHTTNLGFPLPEGKWPWGVLSADERTGYVEQDKKIYEPFLPVRADIINFGSKKTESLEAGQEYRLGYVGSDENFSGKRINDWFIMIEEGWVRITKTCENCCDASRVKKTVPPNLIPISEEDDVRTFSCDGSEIDCLNPYVEDGAWVGKCEGLIYMPEDYYSLDDMAVDYGGTWELEYTTSDGYDVYLFGDGSRWKNISTVRIILCPESED